MKHLIAVILAIGLTTAFAKTDKKITTLSVRNANKPPIQNPPAPVPIYLLSNGKGVETLVWFGNSMLRMLVDTGADECVIPENVADTLVSEDQATWSGTKDFALADGTVRSSRRLLVKEVRIGPHVIRDVPVSVVPVSLTTKALLAFPLLNGIAPFTIDTRAGMLTFH